MAPLLKENKLTISKVIFWLLVINLLGLNAIVFWHMLKDWQSRSSDQGHSLKTATPIDASAAVQPTITSQLESKTAPSSLFFDNLVDQKIATVVALLNPPVIKPAPPVSSQAQATVYVPLGGGNIVTTSRDWFYPGGAEAYFNKVSYPGVKNIYFEVFLKREGSSEANARIYDVTTQVVMVESEVVGRGEDYVLAVSGPLPVFAGNNLLQVQLRSANGYPVSMQGARLRLEY